MQSVSPSTRRLERRLRRRRLWETVRALAGFATARMREANLVEVASSMTLTTLLSLVPLMAVSLAVFAAFPSFADARAALEDAVLTSFLPTEQSETIVRYIKEFSSHASGLGVFGLAGLSLTALLMIDKLFVTMNRIFKVRRMRPWSQRALIYWALLTIGPAALALSLSMTGKLTAMALEGVGSGEKDVHAGLLASGLPKGAAPWRKSLARHACEQLRPSLTGAFARLPGCCGRGRGAQDTAPVRAVPSARDGRSPTWELHELPCFACSEDWAGRWRPPGGKTVAS